MKEFIANFHQDDWKSRHWRGTKSNYSSLWRERLQLLNIGEGRTQLLCPDRALCYCPQPATPRHLFHHEFIKLYPLRTRIHGADIQTGKNTEARVEWTYIITTTACWSVLFDSHLNSCSPCGGGIEYLHLSPVSRIRRRKGNPVPGV
jgi:predicted  nucleic acid-binding Zn ribbon protein